MKPKLLIFSQCFVYGGSERLMQSIYKNSYILEHFNITFSYSYFKDYKDGLNRDCSNEVILSELQPLYLLTNGDVFYKINLKISNMWLRKIFKIPLYLIDYIGIYALYNSIYLYIFLLKSKPQIVHINNGGYPAASACNLFAFVLNFYPSVRVIYQVNNKAVVKSGFSGRVKDYCIEKAVDLFLTHSNKNREALIKRGFNENIVKTVPSYFHERIVETNLSVNEIRKNRFTLCMVGFLSHRKGQLYLLHALTEMKKRKHPIIEKIQINLVGNGEERFTLTKYIEEHSLHDIVTLWGGRTDYIHFIQECDIYMMTSIEGEDLPLVLLSAMQKKKCIIASDFAGISDLLTHRFDAFLVKPHIDTIANEISDAIVYLYENPEVRKTLSENVEYTFNEKLGEEKYAMNLIEFYTA